MPEKSIKRRIRITPEDLCDLFSLDAITEDEDGEVRGWLMGRPDLQEDVHGNGFWEAYNPIDQVRDMQLAFNVIWGPDRKEWFDRISREDAA